MTDVIQAEVPGAEEGDYVEVALAHPLNERDLERLGLPKKAKTYPGTIVSVYKQHAKTLITAGYAQVDSEDPKAIKRVLSGKANVREEASKPAEDATNTTRTEETIPGPIVSGPGQGEGTDRDAKPAAKAAKRS